MSVLFALLLQRTMRSNDEFATICAREHFTGKIKNMVDFTAYTVRKEATTASRGRSESIRERTILAHEVVRKVYERNAGKLSDAELKTLIRETLGSFYFGGEHTFFFVARTDEFELFLADQVKMKKHRELGFSRSEQTAFLKNLFDLAKASGEGFYEYESNRSGNGGERHREKTFIKYFAPFDWVIGTGFCRTESDMAIKEKVLRQISSFRQDGYLFVIQYDGLYLSHPQKEFVGKNLLLLEDLNGVRVTQKLIKKARGGGGLVEYVWDKYSTGEKVRKLSYVQGVPEWEWVIGTGAYLDDIKRKKESLVELLQRDIKLSFLGLFLFVAAALLVFLFFSNHLSEKLRQEMGPLLAFCSSSRSSRAELDLSRLKYEEFSQIAEAAIEMNAGWQQAEKNYLKSHAEFEAIFNSITDAIIFVDVDWRVILTNPAFSVIFGYEQDELIGETTQLLYEKPEDFTKQWGRQYQRIVENKDDLFEISYRRKDGTVFPGETLALEVRDPTGETLGFLGIVRDVSELKETRRNLQQSYKMEAIGTLAGGIAHDFNNILAVILGYTSMAKEDAPEGSKLIDDLDMVLTAGNRAKELVKQILAFSRRADANRSPIRLQNHIGGVLNMLRASIPSTVKIEEEIDPQCEVVLADPTQFSQVVMNLCTNASHAMEGTGGILKIKLRNTSVKHRKAGFGDSVEVGEYVELVVSDTGCGMSPAVIDKIFDPYFTTKKVGRGTGMGLAIIHGIIADYGGGITVESKVGVGTTFHIFIPVANQEELLFMDETDVIIGGYERILFVDDEELLVKMGKDMLERLGYKVTACQSSLEALAVFQKNPDYFDLVITDQTMPDMTGMELGSRMLQVKADIPIILCTGHSNLVDRDSVVASGIKELVAKPLTGDAIAALIRKFLKTP